MSLTSKQKTLFQTWKRPHNLEPALHKDIKVINNKEPCAMIDLVDDDELVSATVALESSQSDKTMTSFVEDLPGFEKFAGRMWIYPTNYPVREYQLSIVKTALFTNTLVALPTGLGKTFIASVVMYNFYRWYPQGKIVFMAPTKPLVSQQIEACYNIMGIPMDDQAQITGSSMPSNRREELWSAKRVFFLTPQVINNDLTRGVCPAVDVKCIVIDEAHKALGNHAYCQVVQQLVAYNRNFRILALTATPGSDLKSVQQVIKNLLISRIEVRSEESIDIKQYTHARKVEKVVVKLDGRILQMKEKYLSVIQLFIDNLVSNKALYMGDVSRLSKYPLLMSRDQFRKDPPCGLPRQAIGIVEGDFAISISLYHGLELLLQHGTKSFFIFIKGIVDGSRGSTRAKSILQANPAFCSIYEELIDLYGGSPTSTVLLTQADGTQHARKDAACRESAAVYVYGHPKMKKLEEVVVSHFRSAASSSGEKEPVETRVMIFCQYRDSVREITELLQNHRPLIRPMQFVGHASSTSGKDGSPASNNKTNRRFTQKDQLMVVSKFRSGGYNTLVSTCVGEEGLDIGDVDLIVCFDAHKSPIRLVQRMGRTGRKREGRIVMLVTEGKEERDYNSSVASRKSVYKAIAGAGKSLQFYQHSPRMVPQGLDPVCHKMFITVAEQSSKAADKKSKAKKKTQSVGDVSVLLKKALQKNQRNALLTDEQKEKWRNSYQLSTSEKLKLKKLPDYGQSMYLNKELFQQSSCAKRTISFSEWLPWQCRLQHTAFVKHSSRCVMLTEMLEACEVIKQLDEKSIETYFGKTGTNPDSDKPHAGIEKFVTARRESGEEDDQAFAGNAENDEELVVKRKRSSLKSVVISSDEDDFVAQETRHSKPNASAVGRARKLVDNGLDDGRDKPGCSYSKADRTNVASSHVKKVEVPKKAPTDDHLSVASDKSSNCDTRHADSSSTSANAMSATRKVSEASGHEDSAFRLCKKQVSPSISDNLPAILATPLDVKSTAREEGELAGTCRIPTPPNIDSIAFSFLDDFNNASDKSCGSEEDAKPACFKLWDSDKEDEKVEPNAPDVRLVADDVLAEDDSVFGEQSSEKGLFDMDTKVGASCAEKYQEVFTAGPSSVCDSSKSPGMEEVQGAAKRETPQVNVGKQERRAVPDLSRNQVSDEETSKNDDFKIAARYNESVADPPGNLIETPHSSRAPTKPCTVSLKDCKSLATDSFDMSADMFAPQFDLDFDLGTCVADPSQDVTSHPARTRQDVEAENDDAEFVEKIAHGLASPRRSQWGDDRVNSVKGSPSTSQHIFRTKSSKESTSNTANVFTGCGERTPGNGPVPLEDGVDAHTVPSQANRRENRALFADLSGAQAFERVPVAKVRPHRVSPVRDVNPDDPPSNHVVGSPTLVSGKKLLCLKRRKPWAAVDDKKIDISSDEDDCVALRKIKRRCFDDSAQKFPFASDSAEDVSETPVKSGTKPRTRLLSTDTSVSDVDRSLADLSSPARGAGGPIGSPVLTLSAKQKRRPKALWRSRDVTSLASSFDLRTPDVVRKHSTPKCVKGGDRSEPLDLKFARFEPAAAEMRRALPQGTDQRHEAKRPRQPFSRFIVDEAEVSKDGIPLSSDEEEDEEEDEEMRAFVNDATQLTQHIGENDSLPNERAMYLRSVRSPYGSKGPYKLAYNVGQDIDVYSQAVEKDDSYEEDSFCVAGDDSECVDDLGEVTVLDHLSSDESLSTRRPKTRRQAKLTSAPSNAPPEPKVRGGRRRIFVCDDEDDSDDAVCAGDEIPFKKEVPETLPPTSSWHCLSCTFVNPEHQVACKVCGRDRKASASAGTSSPARECELCGAVLDTKGWLCRQCVMVMKRSKSEITSERPIVTGKAEASAVAGLSKPLIASPAEKSSSQSSHSLNTSLEERIKRSKARLLKSRRNLEKRRSGAEGKRLSSSSTDRKSTQGCTPGGASEKTRTAHFSPVKINDSLPPATIGDSSVCRSRGKLVVVVDNREVATGANRLVQLLRTQHDVDAVVTSLQCCDYAVGWRTAVFRRTASDLQSAGSKHKILDRFKQARMYFPKLFLIVEKDRVKKGLKGSGVSAAHLQNYFSNVVALTQGDTKVLYSDDQDQSADLIGKLALRERHAGDDIDAKFLRSSDAKHKAMMKVCRSLPGVSHLAALALCHEFPSVRRLFRSSVDELVKKGHVRLETARNLHRCLRKTFDLQMTPI